MAEIVLNVELRDGEASARAVRRQDKVPGVLYGGSQGAVSLAVRSQEFRKALYTGQLLGHLVTLKYGEETQPVIAKDVQFHPVTDEPMHFDLYRVDAHQTIRIAVPLHFRNQDASPGIKRGGTLNIVEHQVEVRASADSIPEELVADLTGLEIGDTIRIGSLTLPQGVEATHDADYVLATITGASALEIETEETSGEEGGGEAAEAPEQE